MYNYLSTCEITLTDMDKVELYETKNKTKQIPNHVYDS